MPAPLEIRNQPPNASDIFGPLLIFLVGGACLLNDDWVRYLFIPFALFSVALVWNSYRRLHDRSAQVRVDTTGIYVKMTNQHFPWKCIKYAFIKRYQRDKGGDIYRLLIDHNQGEFTLDMAGYEYDSHAFTQAVEKFSGRDIGEESDRQRDEVAKILEDQAYPEGIVGEAKALPTWIATKFFLVMVGLVLLVALIYFTTGFLYIFVIGIGTLLFSHELLTSMAVGRFRQQESVRKLPFDRFQALMIEFRVLEKPGPRWARRIFPMACLGIATLFTWLATQSN